MIGKLWTKDLTSPYDAVQWVVTPVTIKNDKTGEIIYRSDGVEHPRHWSANALETCASKYFRRSDVPGIGGEHSIRQLIKRVANCFRKHGESRCYFADETQAQLFEDELVVGFLTQRVGWNSPVWFNYGLHSEYGITGSAERDRFYVDPATGQVCRASCEYERPSGAACYISAVRDTLFASDGSGMADLLLNEQRIFLTGAGDGVNISNIRGTGEPISGGGRSAGLIAYLKVRDANAGYIRSGGKSRRSATLLCCDLDHPDIIEFIEWKDKEEKKATDLIAAGHDGGMEGDAYMTVSGQNSNNSIRISDAFLEAVKSDAEWYLLSRVPASKFPSFQYDSARQATPCAQGSLVFDASGKPVGMIRKGEEAVRKIMGLVKARELWNKVCASAWNTGCPGIQFDDIMNAWNPTPHYGRINATNPCFGGGVLVPTRTGLVSFSSWASSGRIRDVWNPSTNRWQKAKAFLTKTSDTVLLRFSDGRTLSVTEDHRLRLATGGEIRAGESLNAKVELCLPMPEIEQVDSERAELLSIIGFVHGDGSYHEASKRYKYVYLGVDDSDVKVIFLKHGLLDGSDKREDGCSISKTFGDELTAGWLRPCPLPERGMTPMVLSLPPSEMAMFLRGLFSANGNVLVDHARITLKTTCHELAQQVQQCLVLLGIRSCITTTKKTIVQFKNGEYCCRESYGVNITSKDIIAFRDRVGFIHSRKTSDLDAAIASAKFGRRIRPKVVEITRQESMPVYDFSFVEDLPDHERWGCIAGVVAHNCGEVCLPDWSACNLGTINLMPFFSDLRNPDWKGFEHACKLMTLSLDLVVDLSTYPTEKHALGAWNLRPVGLNHGNVGAVLMRNGIPYDSEEGRSWISAITSAMTLFAAQQSVAMAKHMGKYPQFSYEDHKRVLSMHAQAIEKVGAKSKDRKHGAIDMQWLVDAWNDLVESPSLKKHGMRNSSLTTMAPQGTIGLVLDQDTNGCEPDYCLVKHKKLIGGSGMVIPNQSVAPALSRLGYSEQVIAKIVAYVQRFGTVEGCQGIKAEDVAVFDCAVKPHNTIDFGDMAGSIAARDGDSYEAVVRASKTKEEAIEALPKAMRKSLADRVKIFTRSISIDGHVKALAAIQPHISLSMSKTVNMPNEASVDDVANAFSQAHKLGIKGIAIYRDGSRESQPLNASPSAKPATSRERGENGWNPTDWPAVHRPTPNHTANCDRFKFKIADTTGPQSVFVNVVLYPDSNEIMELFLNMGRQGDTVNGMAHALARIISTSLQYGVPAEVLGEKLEGMDFKPSGFLGSSSAFGIHRAQSIPDLIGRLLMALPEYYAHDREESIMHPSYGNEVQSITREIAKEIEDDGHQVPITESNARKYGFTGVMCQNCGSWKTIGSIKCQVCQDCGNSNGPCLG